MSLRHRPLESGPTYSVWQNIPFCYSYVTYSLSESVSLQVINQITQSTQCRSKRRRWVTTDQNLSEFRLKNVWTVKVDWKWNLLSSASMADQIYHLLWKLSILPDLWSFLLSEYWLIIFWLLIYLLMDMVHLQGNNVISKKMGLFVWPSIDYQKMSSDRTNIWFVKILPFHQS